MLKRLACPLVVILSLACSLSNASPTVAPLPTSAPEATLVPQTEPTSPRATETQAPAPQDTATPQPIPNAPLSQTGPWLLVPDDRGLWALNPDGSGFTQLASQKVISPLMSFAPAVSPDGHHVAFVTAADPKNYVGLTLNLLTLPEGTLQTLTPLMKPDVIPFVEFGSPESEAARAIGDYPSVAWSPDGRKLAFIGAQDGPSSDLYVYSLVDGSITRLTDGPGQTYGLSWSPDGAYIVHVGVEGFGTGAGASLAGVWAARADGAGVEMLYMPSGGDEKVIGWLAPDSMIVEGWNVECGYSNVRVYNIETGGEFLLRKDCFDSFAFDPVSKTLAFAVGDSLLDFIEDKRPGVFLWSPGAAEPLQISESSSTGFVEWSADANLFYAGFSQGQASAFDVRGTPASLPEGVAYFPAVSSEGDYAWIGDSFVLEVTDLSGPVRQVFDGAGYPLAWSPDGQNLFFTDNRQGLYVARKPDFAPVKIAGLINANETVWLNPSP